jgi:hypothetical protein
MHTVPGFDELSQTIHAGENRLKVLPPRGSGKNGILTGSMLYTKTTSQGRTFDDQIAFMGPPCTVIPPVQEGRVRYPKLTIQLNRKDGKPDENDPKDVGYTEERATFVTFLKDMEALVLARVREDPKAFFGGKEIAADNVIMKHSLMEPEEDNYRTKFSCKMDLKDEAGGAREDIAWDHVKIDIHDVMLDEQGNVAWKPLTLEDVGSRDKVLPIFRSAYPYFEVVKNHRTNVFEGYCKIQWCLSGLQRIEKVNDHKRKRDDENQDVHPSWMSKIKEYIQSADNTEAADDDVQGENDAASKASAGEISVSA